MMTSILSWLPAVALLAACGSSAHGVRFANAPAVTVVDDRRDTPGAPAPRELSRMLYHFRADVIRQSNRALELRRSERSLGVNALDEVPDSTWFTNRIGVRDVSLDELHAGPTVFGEPRLPMTIKGTKVGGIEIGFIVTDARGEKFILKFDQVGLPETETAADVIVNRLLWAIGYNVPEDHVVYFRASDLVLPADAKIKDVFGNARPLKQPELERLLAQVEVDADGRIRGIASHMLEGKWLGGHPDEGVRTDDPNDRIRHERRRELRGTQPIFSWLDHVDVKEDNTLDMWVADATRHYVRHYLIDFGKSLGTMAASSKNPRRSFAYELDLVQILGSFATAGLGPRPWEHRTAPALRGVGLFESATYVPPAWLPNSPSYLPLSLTDDVDGFWGAKLAMRFTRAQLHAAVEAARLTDPRAVEYITDTLVERQRITARYWFSRVAPLDRFAVDAAGALCFDDLTLTYQLSPVAAITTYSIATTDRANRPLETTAMQPAGSGHTCTPPLRLAAEPDGYTVVQVRTQRHHLDATTYVHLARRDGTTHVVGIWRQGAGQ